MDSNLISDIIDQIEFSGWSFTREVLSAEELKTINSYFQETYFAPAKIGKDGKKQRVESIRGDFTAWLDPLSPPAAFVPIVEFLEKLRDELNRNFFFGLKQFEFHLAVYPPGAYYHKHLDRFENDSSRYFSFVFYLHQEWSANDGGELILYNEAGDTIETILPVPGSMACFLSADFPHEVKTSFQERRSLTGWMNTKIIY
jgi:SM-20-related protein